jgi:hypothetical protein
MTQRIPKVLDIGSLVASLAALGASSYALTLPYRISSLQEQLLGVSVAVQFIGATLALAMGIAANLISRHQRVPRRGLVSIFAIVFAAIALLWVLSTASYAHSTSRKLGKSDAPNDALQATPGLAFLLFLAQLPGTPELGR